MKRISQFCDADKNSFSLMRLIASVCVVFSHSYLITNGVHTLQPLEALTGYPLGTHSVNIFFAISGLLIAASFSRNPNVLTFLVTRFFRIYPALIISSIVVFILCLVFAGTQDFLSVFNSSVFSYFFKILIEFTGSSTLVGVFEKLPSPNRINVPIWTLKYEIMCYLSFVFVMVILIKRKIVSDIKISTFFVVICLIWLLQGKAYNNSTSIDHIIRFSFLFWSGVLCWNSRNFIIINVTGLIGLFFLTALTSYMKMSLTGPFCMITSTYLCFYCAQYKYGIVTRFTQKNDLSYGIYIYSWPVQQLIQMHDIGTTPITNTLFTLIVVIPLAFLSWNLVEKPSLKLKNSFLTLLNACESFRNLDRFRPR
jgi:peptidoglycan/LPS O-acetylase OafA/YrhL